MAGGGRGADAREQLASMVQLLVAMAGSEWDAEVMMGVGDLEEARVRWGKPRNLW